MPPTILGALPEGLDRATMTTIEALFQAYFDARRHKRRSAGALAFEMEYERKLFVLHDEIMSGRYRIGESACFISFKLVRREIFAAGFRDRIVHHFIYNAIAPVFERLFIADCYSCRVGRGTSYGIRRADHFIRSCSENYARDCYVLKLDIRGYFMAIDRHRLYGKVEAAVRRYEREIPMALGLLLPLIRQVIFHDPTKHCRIRGHREDWTGLPASKSLFFAGPHKGLPIGNLTSQLFGNVYLDEFDHFMKCALRCRYYGRYVDDFFVVHEDRAFLRGIVPVVRRFLRERLLLDAHERKMYLQHAGKGMPFLGAVIKPHRMYAGNKTKNGFYRSVRHWNERLLSCAGRPAGGDVARMIASVNSYLGALLRFRTYHLRRRILTQVLAAGWNVDIQIAPDYATLRRRCNADGR